MSNINREPTGAVGPGGKKTGGRFATTLFGKGELPLLTDHFQDRSLALSYAHEILSKTGMPYSLGITPIETTNGYPSEFAIIGSVLVHKTCPRCGAPLGNQQKLDRLVQEEEQQVVCQRCNEVIDAISVRVMVRGSQEEAFDAIEKIAIALRDDVGRGVTIREQRMIDNALFAARSQLSETQSQLLETPTDILELPASSTKEGEVSVLVIQPDNRLMLSVNVWADRESRFGLQTVRVPVPDPAIKEMIENYDKSKAFLSADQDKKRIWTQAVESWKNQNKKGEQNAK